ncbi:hypothetical protein [Aquimarina hainanensis]
MYLYTSIKKPFSFAEISIASVSHNTAVYTLEGTVMFNPGLYGTVVCLNE